MQASWANWRSPGGKWFSLRIRVLALIALAVVPLVVARIWQIRGEAREQVIAAQDRALGLARLTADSQEELIGRARTLLDVVARVPVIRYGDAEACHAFLREVAANAAWQDGLWLVQADGRPLCSSAHVNPPVNVSDQPYFQEALATRAFVLSDYTQTTVRRQAALIAALPILNAAGEVDRVVAAALDLSRFAVLPAALQTGEEAALLVDGKGTVLDWRATRHDPGVRSALRGRSLASEPLVRAMLAADSGTIEAAGPDHVERIWGFVQISRTNARFAVGLPKAQILAQSEAAMRRSLILIGVIGSLATLLAWIGGELFLMRNVHALARAARAIGRGDYQTRAALPPSAGELTIIADAVDEMAARVQGREAEIAEKTALLEATLENMAQGLMMIGPDSRVQVCNRRAIELLDLPADLMASHPRAGEVIDLQASRGEFDDIASDVRGLFEPKIDEGESSYTYERKRPDGTVLEVRTAPLPVGGVVRTYSDITARRQAEAAIRESEARYRLLAENASDMIGRTSLTAIRRYVSPASRDVLGYTADELVGTRLFERVHPDDLAEANRVFHRLVTGKVGRATSIHRLRHKRGHWIWVEVRFRLVRDPETGDPVELVTITHDISDRQRQAEELKTAKEAAEQASQAKSDFLASMSHEIRTPLNCILGYTDLLLADRGLDPDHRHGLERIQSAGAALLTVVSDILNLSKIEAGQVELEKRAFSLEALVDNAVSIVRGLASKKGLEIQVQSGPGLPKSVIGDQDRLRQILLNLLNNAVKFTPRGEVTLTVERVGPAEEACQLRFAVRDTGIGIPKHRQVRLFQRFSQAESTIQREFGGTGLGLAICRSLVELMGGEIGVESSPGQGSTFWFMVTLPEAETSAVAACLESEQIRVGRPARILLVEDVDINREVACALLEAAGHEVVVVADGAEAVAAVQVGTYDLVLMDIQMPGMDGITATKLIRASEHPSRDVPVVALTANVLPTDLAQFRQAGINSHIGKPLRRHELYAVIEQWRAGYSMVAAPPPAHNGHGVVDRGILSGVADLLGPDVIAGELRRMGESLQDCFAADPETADRGLLSRQAHAMISTASTLGFMEFAERCRELEESCLGPAPLGPALDRIILARSAVLDEIGALQAELIHRAGGDAGR